MFETAELNQQISNEEFDSIVPKLRENLLQLQNSLHKGSHFQTILVFAGVDGAGKGETVGVLNNWMDPRWLITRAYDDQEESEHGRPEFWKYWRDLPPKGRIGLFLSAWYSRPVLDKVYGKINESVLNDKLERILKFERALAQDGALILKFWMHLSRKEQEKRLKNLEQDPLTKARVTKRDWKHWKMYDKFIETAELTISKTNRGISPWTIVEGSDANFRSFTVADILRESLQQRLEEVGSNKSSYMGKNNSFDEISDSDTDANNETTPANKVKSKSVSNKITILDKLIMPKPYGKSEYAKNLVELQARLHRLHIEAKAAKISSILVFEGPDAAGKGGAIRRLTESLDPRNFQVHGFAAPTDEEKAQHHLWRFWRRLPKAGHICIFDRSWYGRVLVERVEGFALENEWKRGYAEINEFESQIIENNVVLMKFWIHITKDEQLKRFELREKTPHKKWKLTEEDWRNREKWEDYQEAVNDMVQFTSNASCPWILVEGNDKKFARIKTIRTFCNGLESALKDAGK